MHHYKQLQTVSKEYAKHLTNTIKLLKKIQQNEDFNLDDELIKKYEDEKMTTEILSKRFKELVELTKNSN
jgi:hypothetical protein